MNRSIAGFGAALLVVLVAGCGRGGTSAAATVPVGSATVAAPATAPSTVASASGAPSSVSATPTTTASWLVSGRGIGPLLLGRTWKDLSADPAVVGLTGDIASCPTASLMSGEYQFAITFDTTGASGPNATVTSVGVMAFQGQGRPTPPVVGQGGVTLGSSAAGVEAAYPGGSWGTPAFNPAVERIYVLDAGPVTFGVTGDRVEDIVVGARDVPYEYCG